MTFLQTTDIPQNSSNKRAWHRSSRFCAESELRVATLCWAESCQHGMSLLITWHGHAVGRVRAGELRQISFLSVRSRSVSGPDGHANSRHKAGQRFHKVQSVSGGPACLELCSTCSAFTAPVNVLRRVSLSSQESLLAEISQRIHQQLHPSLTLTSSDRYQWSELKMEKPCLWSLFFRCCIAYSNLLGLTSAKYSITQTEDNECSLLCRIMDQSIFVCYPSSHTLQT